MKIRFLTDHRPKGNSPDIVTYHKGRTYGFDGPVAEGYARKYIGLNLAVEVDPLSEAQSEEFAASDAADRAQAEADRLKAEEDRIAARNAVAIPKNWEGRSFAELRPLAANFSDEPVKSKAAAVAAIRAELERRQA